MVLFGSLWFSLARARVSAHEADDPLPRLLLSLLHFSHTLFLFLGPIMGNVTNGRRVLRNVTLAAPAGAQSGYEPVDPDPNISLLRTPEGGAGGGCGNFDIILVHPTRVCQPSTPPLAPCAMFYLVSILTGC